MTSPPYCYGESNLSNNEDNHYIDRVEVKEKDENVELVEPINQYMTPPTFEFKVYECCNDSRYVERDYEHGITYWKAWMAQQKILKWLFRTYEKSFQNLRTMLLAIKYPNPRTIIVWDYKMIIDNKTMSGRAF
ncbi:hypothetical protein Peur_061008 [Populus x canadensis]